MAVQVKEAANALGKAIAASKVHLEAARHSRTPLEGDWQKFIMDSETPNN